MSTTVSMFAEVSDGRILSFDLQICGALKA